MSAELHCLHAAGALVTLQHFVCTPCAIHLTIAVLCTLSPAGSNFNFHAPDGSGYKFVADAVLLLDKVNRWQVGF